MYPFFVRWAFRLAGPVMSFAAPYLPAASTIKTVFRAVICVAVLVLGASVGWLLHSWNEPEQLERARVEAVEKAELRTRVETQRQALGRQTETLQLREQQLDATETELDQLKQQMEAIRAKSQGPGRAVLPADDPWVLSKRARGGPLLAGGITPSRPPAPISSPTRSTRSSGAATRSNAAKACAGSSDASSCGSRRATCSATHGSRRPSASSRSSRRHASKWRWRRCDPRCRSR